MQRLVIAIIVLGLTSISTAAVAQSGPEGEKPYRSPMKEQCNAELAKDAQWWAEIKNDVRAEVHSEDAAQMLTNKKHVVAAYAVLWGLVVLFVVFMWIRQRRLTVEIGRLEDELRRAIEEE